jgi:uncharacterized protein (UPF0332 family)
MWYSAAMSTDVELQAWLTKAEESLATAVSELANGRSNSCANRCYYACFQAAIAALRRAGIASPRADGTWPHAFVQAQFAQLINRRKEYPEALRGILPRLITLRHRADYEPAQVNERQVARAVRSATQFFEAICGAGGDIL